MNFSVDREIAAAFLPDAFEPQLVEGRAVAGVCLIGLTALRPRGVPRWLGLGSENAAHRFAVVRRETGEHGVFIPRRDTDSLVATLLGGRAVPGVHHRADFTVASDDDDDAVAFASRDGHVHVEVSGRVSDRLPVTSIFASVVAASGFFEKDVTGWSATPVAGRYDCLELRTDHWRVDAFDVDHVRSSFFDDITIFPPGTVRYDHALVMRRIPHTWHPRGKIHDRR